MLKKNSKFSKYHPTRRYSKQLKHDHTVSYTVSIIHEYKCDIVRYGKVILSGDPE